MGVFFVWGKKWLASYLRTVFFLSLAHPCMQIKAALSCVNTLCISQTASIPCFNFVLHSTERITPVDFPSLCNSGSEVKWSIQHVLTSLKYLLWVLGVFKPAAEPEDPKRKGCPGNLGCRSDFIPSICFQVLLLCCLWSFCWFPLLLISVTVYFSLVLFADLPLEQFSAKTQNTQLYHFIRLYCVWRETTPFLFGARPCSSAFTELINSPFVYLKLIPFVMQILAIGFLEQRRGR